MHKSGCPALSRSFCSVRWRLLGLSVTARFEDFVSQVAQGVLVRHSPHREQELMEKLNYMQGNPVQQW
jgi:hypothetical protein